MDFYCLVTALRDGSEAPLISPSSSRPLSSKALTLLSSGYKVKRNKGRMPWIHNRRPSAYLKDQQSPGGCVSLYEQAMYMFDSTP